LWGGVGAKSLRSPSGNASKKNLSFKGLRGGVSRSKKEIFLQEAAREGDKNEERGLHGEDQVG